jgi:tetratricopeptide (TPR) repeat protein
LALTLLADNYGQHLRIDEATELRREALAIAEKNFGPDDIWIGEACNDLACSLVLKLDYQEAARQFRRALRIFKSKLGPDHIFVAICRSNLANALDRLNLDKEAWRLYEEGLAVGERTGIRGGGDAALNHRRMAEFLNRRRRTRDAERHARAALANFRGHPGGNWAMSAEDLAISLQARGHPAEAAALHAEADSVWRENGKAPRQALRNLLEWGMCLREARRNDEAAKRLDEACARFKEEFGESHADYPEYVLARAELDADRGRWDAAMNEAETARARLAAQVAAEPATSGGDRYAIRDRRANLARANAVLERARTTGYAAGSPPQN